MGGRWGRLTRTQAQVEAEELLAQQGNALAERIDCCHAGDHVTVQGMVRSMTLRPRGSAPALEIELYDGSGSVTVVWMGRRRIPGISPGRTMVVSGRLTGVGPTIYNPRYELKPLAS